MHHENAIGILDFEMQNDLYIYMHTTLKVFVQIEIHLITLIFQFKYPRMRCHLIPLGQ